MNKSKSKSTCLLVLDSFLALSMVLAFVGAPTIVPASAQSQVVTVTPGYINLGMNASITVAPQSSGTYTVVVEKPSGATAETNLTFASSGGSQSAVYGNLSSGFMAAVDEVGTYNVFVQQGAQVLGSTSFYATDRLVVTMDMVTGGTCAYIQGAPRGLKMFPRFDVTYASTGAPVTNTDPGISVNYTLPNKALAAAKWDSGAHLFVGKLSPNWNYTYVGLWSPAANISDAAGNKATFQYTGSPFTISPSQLSTSIRLFEAGTQQVATSLYAGENVTIEATVAYPTNAEPVPGFVAPLSPSRGGTVDALVGWGFFNATTGTFGGTKSPGGLITTVHLAYSGANGTWTGEYSAAKLPALPAGTAYQVVVTSSDSASPANTGFGTLSLGLSGPAQSPAATTSTVTTTSVQTVSQVVQSVPAVVYAGMVILLIVGLIIGLVLKVRS